jgi:hypothetical protein
MDPDTVYRIKKITCTMEVRSWLVRLPDFKSGVGR